MSDTAGKADAIEANSPTDDMEQLRQLVFGDAQRKLEAKIESVNNELTDAIDALRQSQVRQFAELHESINDSISKLDAKLDSIDAHHEDNHSSQLKANELLQSQIEMTESAGKDDADALNDRINKEMSELAATFEDKYAEAMKKLEQVTHELTDSKTDRKTLARLLATMASNLETD
ncbi:hypothetical protein ISG33_11900 [Glaciecola sp. MH2013]|uniref:hypothetical protein n=1 Tax=Glaciecola sp. MH2013 TaxID=2785524 RepID=UPI00189CFB27|nr:hypothetical protein [Glaciecola sp. MH2013]MBF7074103.1 hypothetical protein [Glaciecola sp. MH2013]